MVDVAVVDVAVVDVAVVVVSVVVVAVVVVSVVVVAVVEVTVVVVVVVTVPVVVVTAGGYAPARERSRKPCETAVIVIGGKNTSGVKATVARINIGQVARRSVIPFWFGGVARHATIG